MLYYGGLVNSPCPVGRHELTNREWILVGILNNRREELFLEQEKAKREAEKEDNAS